MNQYPKFKTTFTRVMKLVGDCGRNFNANGLRKNCKRRSKQILNCIFFGTLDIFHKTTKHLEIRESCYRTRVETFYTVAGMAA